MENTNWTQFPPDTVLDFWFPQDGHWENTETHIRFWTHRMQGGVDDEICAQFGPLTKAAAKGHLDHWIATPRGRLALVIALDQFPRSLWRDTPGAYGQDIRSANLCCEALANGDWAALPTVWEKQFMLIAIGHAEGPEHLGRIIRCIAPAITSVDAAPDHLRPFYLIGADQCLKTHDIIIRFGRHPHRNKILGRVSTPAEETYLAAGAFPHNRKMPDGPDAFANEMAAIKARLAPYMGG